jgi:diguanylate cyclase (GGDEF)-like protein
VFALATLPVCLAAPAVAAERWADLVETVFQNYGREQGMQHPVPTSLAQDGDGFIWIGTQGGLTRWDGYRFRGYTPDAADPGSVPDNWIQTLHTDPLGRLWIGSGSSGLARYDREHDRFVRFPVGPGGLSHAHVGAIADDGGGGLWIGTDGGLDHLDPDGGTITVLRHDDADPGSLPDDQVQAVLRDRAGRLWVGTAKGLARREVGEDRFATVPLAVPGDAAVSVTALLEDDAGAIWIGTMQHGAFVIDAGGMAARPAAETDPAGATLATDSVSAISAAGEHEIWIGTRGAGIVAIDTGTRRTHRIQHDPTQPRSLAHDDVWALLLDHEGSMWVGGTGGLGYHSRDLGAVSTIFGATSAANGVSDADVYSIFSADDGRIWLGFLGGGVDVLDPVAGRVARLRPDPARPDSALPKDVVTSIAESGDGAVYIATLRGLYRTDRTAGAVAIASIPGRGAHLSVNSLLVDAGVLWIGGRYDGLWGMRLGQDAWPVFGPAQSSGLSDQRVTCIGRGSGQDLWIGTRNGLNRLDLTTGAIERVMPEIADPAALMARYVSATLIDRQGRLWVATFGGGIAVMVGRASDGKPRFHRLGLADGLPHLNIDSLLMDAQGRIWAGTDDGLAVIDPASFAIRALHRAEGSVLADYFVHAGDVDAAGEALFGAKGGLTVVHAGPLEDWSFRPPVVVSEARVGGKPVPAGRFNGSGSADPLVLTPETNSLAVEFAALDFTAPERNAYAYRLDGFDRDWTQTDATRRLAAYTNLPPGRYTLKLRGSNRDGVWAVRDLDIPIEVLPAWYQSLWVRLAAGLALLALVAAVVRSRTAYLSRRQIELEQQVAARTADLRAANDRLYEMATTDPLTGCLNRRHFVERASDLIALAQRYATPVSLVILDIDNFKRVNDTHGHPAGDEVLRTIGRTSQGQIRGTDLVGRMGGEEFALLMPQTTAAAASLIADRLREAISRARIDVEGSSIGVTASFGLAERRRDENFDQLYGRADAALYAAKEAGRNRVVASPDGERGA